MATACGPRRHQRVLTVSSAHLLPPDALIQKTLDEAETSDARHGCRVFEAMSTTQSCRSAPPSAPQSASGGVDG